MSSPEQQTPFTFQDVLADEKILIDRLAEERNQTGDGRIGLSFSGGGIRSATFNLGLLQAFASVEPDSGKPSLLGKVHYLSTVSGGGFIGTWLSGLICQHRAGAGVSAESALGMVEQQLRDQSADGRITGGNATGTQNSHPVRWLRKYSSYLSPTGGAGSPDFWMMIASYLRNVTVNLVILALVICAVFLLFRVGMSIGTWLITNRSFPATAMLLANTLFAVLGCLIHQQLMLVGVDNQKMRACQYGDGRLAVIAGLTLLVSFMQAAWMARKKNGDGMWSSWVCTLENGLLKSLFTDADFYLLPLLSSLIGIGVGTVLFLRKAKQRGVKNADNSDAASASVMFRYLMVYILTGIAFFGVYKLLPEVGEIRHGMSIIAGFVASAVMVFLTIFFCFYTAMLGWLSNTYEHEWWNRLSAWLWMGAIGVGSVFLISIVFPHVWYMYLDNPGATVSGIAAWGAAVMAGINTFFKDADYEKLRNRLLVAIVPWLFVLGVLCMMALVLDLGIAGVLEKFMCMRSIGNHYGDLWLNILNHPANLNDNLSPYAILYYSLAVAGLLLLALVISWRADINLFSLHMFYRNRLVRCYLGASRPATMSKNYPAQARHSRTPRAAHRATNFDPQDGLWMNDFDKQLPYHIINAAVNVNSSAAAADDDAPDVSDWQYRKAQSFVFAPLFCGYMNMFQPTREYLCMSGNESHLSAGLAMTVSGAAANPNMGYHSGKAAAFLMSLFNVRLGWWLQNTAKSEPVWWKKGPSIGLYYLMMELLGKAGIHRNFINVSDGGHFENLGVYELLRRKCSLIIASDAECDGKHEFAGLGKLIHLARVDLGVDIDIDVSPLVLNQSAACCRNNVSKQSYVFGKITYEDGSKGTFVYIKASVSSKIIDEDLPPDIINYLYGCPDFPHETTADQFFDELQFESYRKLGQVIGLALLRDDLAPDEVRILSPE